MRLLCHESDGTSPSDQDMARRLRLMLEAAGHDLLSFENLSRADTSMASTEVGAEVALSLSAPGQGGEADPIAWARREGLKTIALEPDLAAVLNDDGTALKAGLMAFDRVVTFEPRAYEPLERLLAERDLLRCYVPFLDVGPRVAATREAAFHRQNLAARLLLPSDVPWMLASGPAAAGDGLACFRQLSQALSKVLQEPWGLLVQCEGALTAEVGALLRWLPRDRVRVIDAAFDVRRPGLFAACDLFVWPAVGSACGLALLEAQAAGLPVVAEKNDLTQRYVADGITGKLYPPGNFAALTNQISFLLRHANFRESLGQEALKSTPDLFGVLRAARDFNAVLEELLSKGPE